MIDLGLTGVLDLKIGNQFVRLSYLGENLVFTNPLVAKTTHFYNFDNASGDVLDRKASINGTVSGTVTREVTGLVDKCIQFSAGTVNFGNNLNLSAFPFSFSILYFADDITATRVILSGTNTTTYSGVSLLQVNGKLRIRIGTGLGTGSANRKDFETTTDCLVIGWNVITVNCTSTSAYDIYVEKTLYPNTVVAGTASIIDLTGAIYQLMKFDTTFYTGKIDAFGTFNALLTTYEIGSLVDLLRSGNSLYPSSLPLIPSIEVYNKGVNGNNTSDVISRMTDINSVSADLVILMIGYNDWRHPTSGKRRTPAKYKTNLTTIVTSLKANGSQVIMVNFPSIEPTESDYVCDFYSLPSGCNSNATSNDFRTKISEVVSEQSILYYDLKADFDAIGQPNYTVDSYCENALNSATVDGLHFRPIGADFCAEKLKAYILTLPFTYENIVCVGDSQTAGDGLAGAGTNTGETYPAKLKVKLNS